MRFTDPLFAVCVGQSISLTLPCMHVYVCLRLTVCAFESICLSGRCKCVCMPAEWSSAVLVLAQGWGGRCQRTSLDTREEAVSSSSSRKSIRPKHKHKHRRASDSGPALCSPPSRFFPSVGFSLCFPIVPNYTHSSLSSLAFSNAISASFFVQSAVFWSFFSD